MRVLGALMGGGLLWVFVQLPISSIRYSGLEYALQFIDFGTLLMMAYWVALLIPIRFIKKIKAFEIVYLILAAHAVFNICSAFVVFFEAGAKPIGPLSRQQTIGLVLIMDIIFIGIIISNALLVLKWGKFKGEQEPPVSAEASPEAP